MKTVQVPIGQAPARMLACLMVLCVVALVACAEGDTAAISSSRIPTPYGEPATTTPHSPTRAQTSKTASAPHKGAIAATLKPTSTAIPILNSTPTRTLTPTAVQGTLSTTMETEEPTTTAVPESKPTNTPTPTLPLTSRPSVTPVTPTPNLAAEVTSMPLVAWTPVPSPLYSIYLGADPLELLFLGADTVARVRLIEVEGHILTSDRPETSRVYFRPEIRYEFETLEYLKGSGSDRIWAIVYLPVGSSYERGFPSEEAEGKSRAALAYYLSIRENRWDESEAIVFLKDSHGELETTYPEDHYYIGDFFDDIEVYSISAHRKWLPLESLSGATGAVAERQFLLEHPNGHVLGKGGYQKSYTVQEESGAAAAAYTSTVGLSELRNLAAMTEEELSFQWDLSAGYAAIPELTASSTQDSVTLNWELQIPVKDLPEFVIPAETGYSILRSGPEDEDFETIANLSADVMSYTDANIAPSTGYTYILRMFTIHDHSVDVQVKVTTAASPTPEPTPAPTSEPTPTPTAEATPERIPTQTTIPTATPEVETSAQPAATVPPAENADSSAPTSPPPGPQYLTAVVNDDGTITLRWDDPGDDSITGYQILRQRQRPAEGEDTLSVYVEDTGSANTTYTDLEVASGIRHVYQVKTINDAGVSEPSNSAQVDP